MTRYTIPVTCDPERRLRRVSRDQLIRFQGSMKTLSEPQYAKLRESIEQKGFFAPIFLWAGHDYILDGHQRLNVLEREIDLGHWQLAGDGLPVVEIEAADEKDAAEKLLLLSSTYGKIDPQGLYEFTELHEIPLTDFILPELPDFDLDVYRADFYEPLPVLQDYGESGEGPTDGEETIFLTLVGQATAFTGEFLDKLRKLINPQRIHIKGN